jgi:hypothetical protein
MEQLANKLLEKEVIFKEDLIAIFGERPWDQTEEIVAETIAADTVDAKIEVPEVPRMTPSEETSEDAEKTIADATDSTPEEPMDDTADETSPGA